MSQDRKAKQNFGMSPAAFLVVGLCAVVLGTIALSRHIPSIGSKPAEPISVYQIALRSQGALQVSPDTDEGNLTLASEWSGPVHAQWASNGELAIRFHPGLHFTVNGRRLNEQETLLQALPVQTMILRFSADGTPEKFLYHPLEGLPASAAELVYNTGKMILFQLAWKAQDISTPEGLDYWGRHERTWKSTPDGSRLLTASKLKTQSGIRGTGEFDLQFDGKGKLKALKGTQKTSPDEKMQMGFSTTEYEIQWTSSEVASKGPSLFLSENTMTEDSPWIVVQSKAMIKAALEERTQGWSFERVFSEAQKRVEKGQTSQRELLALSTKLEELLWLHPEWAEKLVSLCRELGPQHPFYDNVLQALTSTGDEASQKALISILQSVSQNESASLKVMAAMAFVQNPSVEAQQTLESWASNPATPRMGRTAELLLGQMAYQLSGTDSTRALEIQNRYIRQLESSQDSAKIRHALNVIGNSGLCENFETIARYVGNPDVEIHTRALEALRFCRDSRFPRLALSAFRGSSEDQKLALQILEMRAQRSIYDPEIFQFLLSWLQSSSKQREMARSVVGLLGQLARLDDQASADFQNLKKGCDPLGLCSYF